MNLIEPALTLTTLHYMLNESNIGYLTSTEGGNLLHFSGQDIIHLNPPLLVKDKIQIYYADRKPYVMCELTNTHEYIGNFLLFICRVITQTDPVVPSLWYSCYLVEIGYNCNFTATIQQAPNWGQVMLNVDTNNVLQLTPPFAPTGDKIPACVEIIKKYYPTYPN